METRPIKGARKGAAAGAEPSLSDRWRAFTWMAKDLLLPAYASEAEPVILGGCGRSGTTLMQVILDRHPDIVCVRESAILQPGRLNPGKLAARVGVPEERVASLAASSRRHAEFVERVLAERCASEGVSRWAEKSPRNVHRLSHIFRHFPRATFVHVLRDGRDVACSLRTHPRFGRVDGEVVELGTWNPIDDCARRWVRDVGAGLAWRGHPRYVEVRYEHLVHDAEATLKGLLEQLGLAWDPAVLEGHGRKADSNRTPEFHQPLTDRSLARWERDLSPQDVAVVKAIAGPLLIELGYAVDDGWEAAGQGASPPVAGRRVEQD